MVLVSERIEWFADAGRSRGKRVLIQFSSTFRAGYRFQKDNHILCAKRTGLEKAPSRSGYAHSQKLCSNKELAVHSSSGSTKNRSCSATNLPSSPSSARSARHNKRPFCRALALDRQSHTCASELSYWPRRPCCRVFARAHLTRSATDGTGCHEPAHSRSLALPSELGGHGIGLWLRGPRGISG